MALYPKAKLRLLPENNTQAKIKPRAVIAHSAGGEGELYGWWMNSQSKGLESHFWISRKGEVFQYMDTTVRADANGQANGYAISIETQSTKHASEPWDGPQLQALIALIDWLCDVHNIPRKLMATATGSGLAWHIMFGAPGPWTSAKGKVCPGPARIKQFKEIVVPAVAKGGETAAAKPKAANIIRTGDKGEHVKFLQAMLNIISSKIALGDRKPLATDGDYGPRTTARVKEFEKFNNDMMKLAGAKTGFLQVDGITTEPTMSAVGFWVKAVMGGK